MYNKLKAYPINRELNISPFIGIDTNHLYSHLCKIEIVMKPKSIYLNR